MAKQAKVWDGSSWQELANSVVDLSTLDKRSVPVFISYSAMVANLTQPYNGMIATTTDYNIVWRHDGTVWRVINTPTFADTTTRDTALPAATLYSGLKCIIGGVDWRYSGTAWVTSDTGWISLTLASGWNGNNSPAYRVVNGIVYFRGEIDGAYVADGTFATVPAGARPGTMWDRMVPIMFTPNTDWVPRIAFGYVNTSGELKFHAATTGVTAGTWIYIRPASLGGYIAQG